ncbi:MAG: hypothetical protein IPK58_05720 [Acidobacteria bacterium]|nr:hypothetical protein [Acidobacteriota bacterium]
MRFAIGIPDSGFQIPDFRFQDSRSQDSRFQNLDSRIPRIPDSKFQGSRFQDSRSEFKIPEFQGFQTGNPESRCNRVESVPSAVADGWLRHSRTDTNLSSTIRYRRWY